MPKANPGIYFKIDWLSMMFEGWSIRKIAQYYNINQAFPDYLENGFDINIGGINHFAYDWNGIKWFVKSADLQSVPDDVKHSESIFDVIFPKIKFDLSGQALDFLRENYFEGSGENRPILDDFLRIQPFGADCTRVDFAFDYVEYKPELFSQMIRFVMDQAQAGRSLLLCKGLNGGISYSYRLGDQSTLYLGSTGCEKILRIYDKRRQFFDPNKQCWKVSEDKLLYGKVDSWNRIEYQVRRRAANQILYQPFDNNIDFSQMVLRLIYDRYAFRDPEVDRHSSKCDVLPFWQELAPDWDHYESIVQNSHFVQSEEYIKRCKKYIQNIAFRPLFAYIARYGLCSFVGFLQGILRSIQQNVDSPDQSVSFEAQLRRAGLYTALSNQSGECPDICDFKGLSIDPISKTLFFNLNS